MPVRAILSYYHALHCSWRMCRRIGPFTSIKDFVMNKTFSLTLALLMLIGLAPMLGACHTTAGAGEDLSAGGHALTNSAEKHTP